MQDVTPDMKRYLAALALYSVIFIHAGIGIAQATDTHTQEIVVKGIRFQSEKKVETVIIELNNACIPDLSSIEGDKPRIVLDFRPVSFWKGQSRIKVNGKLIKSIRVHLHQDTSTLRIVLDLEPTKDFYASPTLYKSGDSYFLKIGIEKIVIPENS